MVENKKIESGRAEKALAEVKRVIATEQEKLKEYKSYCKKFPSMVQSNGLAAAIAFAYEKKGRWEYVYENVDAWLTQCGKEAKASLIDYICGMQTAEYRVATREVLAFFNWVRRFASGLIEGD
jgi:CRISPR-associated protein Cmr5